MDTIAFTRGVPASECLPVEELADCARAAIERDGATVLNYGPVAGYAPLREWVAERHGVDTSQVFVTNGSLQGLSLLAAVLVEPGARVLVEGPTYDRALHIVARHHAEPIPTPMDDDGLDPDALALPAAFLYTIPTFQNPSGRTLSLERRHRLAELARDGRLLVVEDDPYSLVRYEGDRVPSVFELAEGEGVVYSFSFSKISAPGLRVGYLLASSDLIARLEALAVQTYLTPALLPQATAPEFVSRGLLEPNIERVIALLRERRDAHRAGGAAARGRSLEPTGGGLLHLGRLPRGRRRRQGARARAGARRQLRLGAGLLPAGRRRRRIRAPRLQLRLARRDPVRRRAASGGAERVAGCGIAARAARRRRGRSRAGAGSPRSAAPARCRRRSRRRSRAGSRRRTRSSTQSRRGAARSSGRASAAMSTAGPRARRPPAWSPAPASPPAKRPGARPARPAAPACSSSPVYAAAAPRANAESGRGTSVGCSGGAISPRRSCLNVGHGEASSSAHNPALWK